MNSKNSEKSEKTQIKSQRKHKLKVKENTN